MLPEAAGQLAHQVVAYVGPHLPSLLGWGGVKVAETLVKKVTEENYAKAKELWAKLWPKVKEDPAAQLALAALEAEPEDTDRQGALRSALKDLFRADPAFAEQVAELNEKLSPRGGDITQSIGERSVAVHEVTGITNINTGDLYK